MELLGIAFCSGCILSLLMVPAVARCCRARGLVDHPDGHRKLHTQPIPLSGGIAVFIVVVLVASWGPVASDALATAFGRNLSFYVGLGLSALVLLATGIADDQIGLRGRQKLAGQLVSALILISSGLIIHRAQVFGSVIDLGVLSVPVTLLWVLGAINAVNLLDGINGLAATVGITAAAALALMSHIGGHPSEAFLAAALAGGLLGFLRYNFPRATVFLGDAGSMLIGLMIAALSIKSSLKGPGTVLLGTPLCLMAIPFFDSAAAIVRRKLTGRSIFSTDRAHLHHCLTDRFGGSAAVVIVGIACTVSAIAAISAIWWQNDSVAVISGVAVIVFFVATRIFGYSELRLLTSRMYSLLASIVSMRRPSSLSGKQTAVRLQGNREWNLLWSILSEAAADLDLQRIELDVNAPSLREGYHAKWESRSHVGPEKQWRFDMPLMAVGHKVGHIRIFAERTSSSAAGEMERVLFMLEEFESQLSVMLRDAEIPAVSRVADGQSTEVFAPATASAELRN